MKRTWLVSSCLIGLLLFAGCTADGAANSGGADRGGTASVQGGGAGTDTAAPASHTLDDVAALLGQDDADTADLLDGGEENWTQDKSTYIGRVYQTELYGQPATVHTVCSADRVVEAVSIWATDGTQAVSDETVRQWQTYLSEFTGADMIDRGKSQESGAQSWQWQTQDTFSTLWLSGDILSVTINPAVGELK